jgi:hypothetical protein
MDALPAGPIDKPRRHQIEIRNWAAEATLRQTLAQREKIIHFLLWSYGASLSAIVLIFYLQGFKTWGFNLDGTLLKWLGGATIGELAGLLTLAVGAVFKHPKA